MDYKKLTAMAALAMGASMIYAQDVEIATWSGFRKGAASFTFDDGYASQASQAAPKFDEKGYKATFNLVTGWSPDWNAFQSAATNGHEIASHSDSHPQGNAVPMPAGEISTSKNTINGKIKQKYGVVTLAYPNCESPGDQQVLQNYVVGRICNGSWKQVSDVMGKDGPDGGNWAKVPALMTGSTGIDSKNDYTKKMGEAIEKNGWVAFLTHGFSGVDNSSYSPTNLNAMVEALSWAKENDKDIWVAPMGYVAMYIKERNASKAEVSNSGNTTTVKLTHNIKDNISDYDYPLTLKVKTSLSKAEVTQGDAKLEATIDDGYVIFDAVPNAGDIVIAGEGAGPSPESSSSAEDVSSSSEEVYCTDGPDDASCNTGIASTIRNSFQLAVYKSSDNYIVVSGAKGMSIAVFNSLGHQLRSTRGLGAEQKVFTGAKGVYVVKVGGRTFKVKL